MSLWLSYKHFSGSIDTDTCTLSAGATSATCGGTGGKVDFKDFQLVKFGALINF